VSVAIIYKLKKEPQLGRGKADKKRKPIPCQTERNVRTGPIYEKKGERGSKEGRGTRLQDVFTSGSKSVLGHVKREEEDSRT